MGEDFVAAALDVSRRVSQAPPDSLDPLLAPAPAAAAAQAEASHPAVAPELGGRRAALGFIFATALMDMLALGIVIPVLPKLVESFTGGNAAAAARYIGVFGAAWALMQFIFSPIQGALSDRFGRRPVLLISIFGLGLDYMLMALSPNLGWLFVGRIISGITAASFSTANAYIADVTPPERRAQSFGWMGRGVQHRLHPGPDAGRTARRGQSAPAVLGGGGPGAGQRSLWPPGPARVAET